MPILKNRSLSGFLCAQAVTTFTSELLRVSIPMALYLLTRDSATVAFAATATFLPRVLLSALSGAAVDRFGVKRSLIAADLIQCAGALFLAAAAAYGLPMPFVYAAVFVISGAATLKFAAVPAAIGELVPAARYTNIYGVLWAFESLAATLSPLAAAVLVDRSGLGLISILYAAGALLGLGLVSAVRIPRQQGVHTTMFGGLRDALRLLRHRRELVSLALFNTFVNLIFSFTFVMFTPMILLLTGNDPYQVARVLMAGGIAQLASSSLLGVAGAPKRPVRAIIVCTAALAVAGPLVIGASASILAWSVAYAATMALFPLVNAWERPVWLLLVDKPYHGRMFGLRRMLVTLLAPAGSFLSGLMIMAADSMHLSPLVSYRLLFLTGACMMLALCGTGFLSRRLRDIDARYSMVLAVPPDAAATPAADSRRAA